MPETFQALAVVLIALVPGATFLWAVERVAGRWGIEGSDRFLRFVAVSLVLHSLAAPATYRIWHDYLRTDALPHGAVLPLWMWPVAAAYVLIPAILGTIFGLVLNSEDVPPLVAGSNRAPSAWDHLFFRYDYGYVRLKLKSGPFIGGRYEGPDSYAGGYPEPPDIYVSEAVEVDADTGEFARDDAGNPIRKGYGFLVRWSEVEYLEFAAL
jgi:Family of unknown function (DUF6338)